MSAIKRRRIVLSDDEDEDTGRNVSAAIASPQLIISPVQQNQHIEDSDASDVLPSSSRKSLRLSSGKKTRSMEKRFAAEKELLKIRSGGLSAVLSSGSESESEHVPNSQFYNLPPPRATRTSPRDTGRPSKCFKDMVTGDRDDADDDDDSMDDFIVNEEDEENEDNMIEDAQELSDDVEEESAEENQKKKNKKKKIADREKGKNDKSSKRKAKAKAKDKKSKKTTKSPKKAVATPSKGDDDEDEAPIGSGRKKGRRQRLFESESEHDDSGASSNDEEEEEEENSDEEELDDELSSDEEIGGPELYWQVDMMREEQQGMASDEEMNFFQHNKTMTSEEAFAVYVDLLAHVLVDANMRKAFTRTTKPMTSFIDSSRFRKYQQASRQVENLICTHRESLLGSSAWKQGFLADVMCRPMYMAQVIAHSIGADDRCDACGRMAQRPDHVVRMFGPSYDAKQIWSSTNWADAIPEVLFLSAYDGPATGDNHTESDRMDMLESAEFTGETTNKQYRAFKKQQKKSKKATGGHGKDSTEIDTVELSQSEGELEVVASRSQVQGSSQQQWWLKSLPRQLAFGEKEVRYNLASHCKNRTQLYHTLLHYKLRLLIKIREYLERCGDVSSPQEWLELAGQLQSDRKFVDGEFRRLQSLLKTAGAQYGGQRYELDMGGGNVWSDNEEIIVASKKDKKRAKKEKKRSKQEGERGGDKDGVGSPSDEDNDAENGNQVEFKRRRQASILQFVKKKK